MWLPAKPSVIVITGASGGLGSALAVAYAEPGCQLLLCGRNEERVAEVKRLALDRGAEVEILTASLIDTGTFEAAIADFASRKPIDLFIANAGVKTGNVKGIEDLVQLNRVIAVNLTGTITSIQAVLPSMLQRRHGHVAIISSLAARSPHADLLSYSATKAGLEAYATGLRRAMLGSGLHVSVVLPGFIDTPMTDRHRGATPLVIPPSMAAQRIRKALDSKRSTIAFPRRLALMIALRNFFLPASLSDRIEEAFRADILPDEDERKSREA